MDWIKRIFSRKQKPDRPASVDTLPPEKVKALLEMIASAENESLSCAEVNALVDQFAEIELSGQDAATLMPLVDGHLHGCQECREEYEALKRILQAPLE